MLADQQNLTLISLAERLRAARVHKRLSQRALSHKIGLPQSHISKIESGQVDIKASSLIELARALGLEIMLVPQALVPAVEALSRSSTSETETPRANIPEDAPPPVRDAHRALEKTAKEAGRLSRALGDISEITRLAEAARALDHLRLTPWYAEQVRDVLKAVVPTMDAMKQALEAHGSVAGLLKRTEVASALLEVTRATDSLRAIRNALAHGPDTPIRRSRPAYRLTDEDDDA